MREMAIPTVYGRLPLSVKTNFHVVQSWARQKRTNCALPRVVRMKIVIESYLTEARLAAALRELVGHAWLGGQISVPGSRCRFDMAFQTPGGTVLVEYDGDEHYRDALKIRADRQKDVLAAGQGMRLVRVPYWVQLDTLTARHWFGLEAAIEQSLPHGFITTRLFPRRSVN